jgi:hypothetical protein
MVYSKDFDSLPNPGTSSADADNWFSIAWGVIGTIFVVTVLLAWMRIKARRETAMEVLRFLVADCKKEWNSETPVFIGPFVHSEIPIPALASHTQDIL